MIARLAIPGAWMWSAWQPDRGMPFNSYLFETPQGAVAIDPLPLPGEDCAAIRERGGIYKIVVTNAEHLRDAPALSAQFGAPVVNDARDGEEVFPGAFALQIENGKSPEFALHLPAHSAAIVGDAILGTPAGSLSLLPDERLKNVQHFVMEFRRLWALNLKTLLPGDGYPVFGGADEAIGALLLARAGAAIYRINKDEVTFQDYKEHDRYRAQDGEVGLLIGARKLGYRLGELPPGAAFCPLHSHVESEEFFYVLEGSPSVRMPSGTLLCREGDFIAFPTGAHGAHQLVNDSARPCRVLLVGNEPANEVCFYPDSRKVLVAVRGGPRLIVRSEPALDYFDGE